MTSITDTAGCAALRLVLVEPEIPQNTGNLVRLAANTGASLELIAPLGFVWDDRRLRRAGLDYAESARVVHHASYADFLASEPGRLLPFTTRGNTRHDRIAYRRGDCLLFGPESRGLSAATLAEIPASQHLRLPMQPGSRSMNLANCAAVALYEGLRQLGFPGLE